MNRDNQNKKKKFGIKKCPECAFLCCAVYEKRLTFVTIDESHSSSNSYAIGINRQFQWSIDSHSMDHALLTVRDRALNNYNWLVKNSEHLPDQQSKSSKISLVLCVLSRKKLLVISSFERSKNVLIPLSQNQFM